MFKYFEIFITSMRIKEVRVEILLIAYNLSNEIYRSFISMNID